MEKPKLLLLPGLLNDATLYEQVVGELVDVADCTVGDITRADSIAALASEVLAKAPKTPFVLAGMSMGGYVALEIVRQAPQRVLALALMDTGAPPDTAEASATREELIRKGRENFPAVIETLLERMAHPKHTNTPEVGGAFQSMAAGLGYEVFVRQQKAIIGRPDSRPSLAAIRCPTLVLCGADDLLTPLALHRKLAAGIAGARLEIVKECGHLAPLEQPEKVAAILRDWLASLPV